MRERPILFSAPMIRAILAGRKTQTRRIVKPQPYLTTAQSGFKFLALPGKGSLLGEDAMRFSPYGRTGDELYVKESCRAEELPSGLDGVRYVADGSFIEIQNTVEASDRWGALYTYRGGEGLTVPAIHMPRWASRIMLRITDIRVEQVQDISDRSSQNDCTAEGVYHCEMTVPSYEEWHGQGFNSAEKCMFRNFWDSIYGKRPGCSWREEPWVWVVCFEVTK